MHVQSLHLDYIVAAANLMAFVFGLKQTRDRTGVANLATKTTVAEFVPKADVKFAQTDDEYKESCKNVTMGIYAVNLPSSLSIIYIHCNMQFTIIIMLLSS